MEMIPNILLSVENVVKYFPLRRGLIFSKKNYVRAVDGVSFKVVQGDNLAIVGESGSGKTTLGRIICRLLEPTSGQIFLDGKNVYSYSPHDYAKLVQPIFQDPYSALNPWKKVHQILEAPFKIHHIKYTEEDLVNLLENVGLTKDFLKRYPHELSGGQRQRIVIARALALRPKIIVADEPVSGLDVTVQTQIIQLLKQIQTISNSTYIVISHDLRLVERLCTRVVVMYLGKICEIGPVNKIISSPVHPYTKSLLASFPSGDPEDRRWVESPPLKGEAPSAVSPPSGCRFRTRCSLAQPKCAMEEPPLTRIDGDHYAACPVVLGGWRD
ncbi:MAG: ABC transporter ATP-binding protein [Candidatus Caldarchaeum sp.]